MKPLLSIVVPTKDRYPYLKYFIELVLSFKKKEIELVIQDNSEDNKEFLDYLKSIDTSTIIYDHCGTQIPISDNSDRAILNSSGTYVCFMGDDDGVTSNILEYVEWMDSKGLEAIRSDEVNYNWPDYGGPMAGVISHKQLTGKVSYLNPKTELIKLLKSGILDRGRIPLVYHGIVRRDVLDIIYNKCGTYFPGQSPDISNGVALALVVEKYAFIERPITISGASKFHGGGSDKNKQKYLDIDARPWLRPHASELWDKRVPMIGVGSLIWAESAITGIKNMKCIEYDRYINFKRIVSHFMLYNLTLLGLLDKKRFVTPLIIMDYAMLTVKRFLSAGIRRMNWYLNERTRPVNIKNMHNIKMVSDYLSTNYKGVNNE